MKAFDLLATWPASTIAVAAISPDGTVHRYGNTAHVFALASVTKLFTAVGAHLAVEEGSIALTDVSGSNLEETPHRGATIADLLSHSGGLSPAGDVLDDPGRRRIYSNGGYERVATAVEQRTEMAFADYLAEGLFAPLMMSTAKLLGSAAHAGEASVEDLVAFATGLSTLLAPATLAEMTSPYRADLDGVLPGYGRQSPNTWGLGPEIRSEKSPHWTGSRNSPSTWGHFGQAGTFFWVDPTASVTLITLTNKTFGDWALPLWPVFADAVLEELL